MISFVGSNGISCLLDPENLGPEITNTILNIRLTTKTKYIDYITINTAFNPAEYVTSQLRLFAGVAGRGATKEEFEYMFYELIFCI